MTNYFMSHEFYLELIEQDKKIIQEVNEGELTFHEGEKQIQELWDLRERKK